MIKTALQEYCQNSQGEIQKASILLIYITVIHYSAIESKTGNNQWYNRPVNRLPIAASFTIGRCNP